MTRPARLGAVLVAFYVVVAAATTWWAPGRLRPLFDGFGSHPGQYNWVNPPREFAEGNQRPEEATGQVAFDDAGSLAASVGPGDGQAAASLARGSLAARPPDTAATLTLTPVDAGELGPLPVGLRPEGNAYRVEITYESGTEVVALDAPGSVGLTSAAPADTLLYSPDGKAWEDRQGQPLSPNTGITGPLHATGYYLAAAKGALRSAGGGSGSGSAGTVVLVVAALAVPAALGWLLLGRRRAARRGGRRAAGGRPRAGATGGRPAGPRGAKPGKATGRTAGNTTGKGPNKGTARGKGAGPRAGGKGPKPRR